MSGEMHLQFVGLLFFASAQLCAASREFTVDNCTACPTIDETRDNITMAVCEERAADTEAGGTYACNCLDFPAGGFFSSKIVYFPRSQGDVTRCANSWATAPQLYAFFMSVSTIVFLYATVYNFYIAVLSGICSCKHRRCTKHSTSGLLAGIFSLCWSSRTLLLIVTNQYDSMIISYHEVLTGVFNVILGCGSLTFGLSLSLLATSISDMVYAGEDMAGRRRCVAIFFWTSTSAYTVIHITTVAVSRAEPGPVLSGLTVVATAAALFAVYIGFFVLIITAHRTTREIVRKHSTSPTKPALVFKLADLSVAICRYFYPLLVVSVIYVTFVVPQYLFLDFFSPTSYWFGFSCEYLIQGVWFILLACILEGKPVPTFPVCLGRRGFKPGLQFTAALGNALALLTKYGLDTERNEDSPMEAAKESLLSKSTLMVAADDLTASQSVIDMDLIGCIEYFVVRCEDDKGEIAERFSELPIGRLLREGCDQHDVTKEEIRKLRKKAERCIQWAQDPGREVIADDMTVDEAAAIQLYTQHSCLYPLLNGALRDHTHPENLTAFVPYLKLLLTALNKLPLLRMKVYRGMNGDFHETYNQLQGQVFRWWAFSSTTTHKSKSKGFMSDTGGRTLFTMDAIGVDISAFSAYPNEREVLLLPGTCLVVEPGVKVADNYWEFEASVLKAAQQLGHTHDDHQRSQQHNEQHDGEGGGGIEPEGIDDTVSSQRFQDTDLPHPGWEEIVSTQEPGSVAPQTPTSSGLL